MSLNVITYKGKKVLCIDYQKAGTEEEMIAILHQAADHMKNSQSKILVISDLTGKFGSVRFMNESKRLKEEVFDAKTEKGVIFGLSPIQEILLKGYNLVSGRKLIARRTRSEALEYLIS